jgi:hypothetical protein
LNPFGPGVRAVSLEELVIIPSPFRPGVVDNIRTTYEITESAAYSAHRHNKLIFFVYAYILHIIVRRSFNRIPNLPLRAEFARYEFIQIREEQSPTVASSPLKPCTQ